MTKQAKFDFNNVRALALFGGANIGSVERRCGIYNVDMKLHIAFLVRGDKQVMFIPANE